MHIPYSYLHLVIGVLLIFAIPVVYYVFDQSMTGLLSGLLLALLMNCLIVRKYGNLLRVHQSKIVIANLLFLRREYPVHQVQRLSLYTEHGFLKDTVYVQIRTAKGFRKFHLGTLSAEHIRLLYDYLKREVEGPVEIVLNP